MPQVRCLKHLSRHILMIQIQPLGIMKPQAGWWAYTVPLSIFRGNSHNDPDVNHPQFNTFWHECTNIDLLKSHYVHKVTNITQQGRIHRTKLTIISRIISKFSLTLSCQNGGCWWKVFLRLSQNSRRNTEFCIVIG